MPRRRDEADRADAMRALGEPGRFERRILEELIYERVRVTVDLCELMAFELDLAASIERALAACAGSPMERSDLTLDYLERAWDRVTEEVMGGFAERELSGVPPGERQAGAKA